MFEEQIKLVKEQEVKIGQITRLSLTLIKEMKK